MDILADTNILIRRINRYDAQHKETRSALKLLAGQGHRIRIVPQNIIECWSVATRPRDRNGPGLLPAHMERIVARIESNFHLLPETGNVFLEWKKLVATHSVSGLKVYDTRLVASAIVHGIQELMMFNGDDFRRYPGLKILYPRDIRSTTQAEPEAFPE